MSHLQGKVAFEKIDEKRQLLKDLAMKLWENPELPYQEFQAAVWVADTLEAEGFQVTRNYAGIKTAVLATWGSGKPVIGLCAEYDALPGMSQKNIPMREPVVEGAPGHACGHNLIAAANVAAAIGLKAEMEERGLPGTIHFYGCPAEEGLTGKVFMARAGAFDSLDAAVYFHPGGANKVQINDMPACGAMKFHFHGKTAHAGVDPYNGRSALDAVELCNVGANYLREHVTGDVRIHYTITDGGSAPNIVPDKAGSHYVFRASTIDTLMDVRERIVNIAKGAAMMTGTTVEIEDLGACYNALPNMFLSDVLNDCMKEAPFEAWSDDDIELARQLNETMASAFARASKAEGLADDQQLYLGVGPKRGGGGGGSGDIGDVMHIAPTICFGTATATPCTFPHSWQNCVCAGSEIGIKGMLYAGKVMALFGIKMMEDPELVKGAWTEFNEVTQGKAYVSPLSPDLQPPN